jgi:pilus assembly protein CpaF
MFTIIISEKGGAERRETFDKNEINVGRVQGNDLMLPKGNVSKHHARLLYRDGRFIVTDLKSTNGTYVNGRKIAQATIVREGDKIYIGDFVLKLDTGAMSQPPAPEGEMYRPDDQSARTPARLAGMAPPPGAPPGAPAPAPVMQQPPMPTTLQAGVQPMPVPPAPPPPAPAPPPPAPQGRPAEAVSHYPLERDPDESESGPGEQPRAAAKAAVPPRVSAPAAPMPVRNSTVLMGGDRAPMPPPQHPARASGQVAAVPPPPRTGGSMPPRQLPRETPAQAGRRLALITLVDRVADVVNLAALKQSPIIDEQLSQQIDRAVREQAKAMRDEGEAPEGVDVELLVRDAVREFIGLGPIGPLLEDEEVSEISCMRHDYVVAERGGQAQLAEASFTSEEALYRVIARLAQQSGDPWRQNEVVIERRLARGAAMIAVAPPASASYVLVIRKRHRVEGSLEELVRSGAMSRPMATFLDHCLTARANILVCGAGAGAVSTVLAALASSGPAGDRMAVLQDIDELSVPQGQVVALALPDHRDRGEETVRAAARLRPDRLVVSALASSVAAATLDAIAEGAEGVLAGVCAPSLRHALARTVANVALARPGASVEAAREYLGESFDVAVEAARMPDGRVRVMRIAELGGGDAKGVAARDLFALSADGAAGGEGAFVASGVVPRMVNEFAARGVKIDANLFKRTVGRG